MGVARAVPEAAGVTDPDCAAARCVKAVAVALMARNSSAMDGLAGAVSAGRGAADAGLEGALLGVA